MPEYFCYQCNRTVGMRDTDFICENCGNGFIEEVGSSQSQESSPQLAQWVNNLFNHYRERTNERQRGRDQQESSGGPNFEPSQATDFISRLLRHIQDTTVDDREGVSIPFQLEVSMSPDAMFIRNGSNNPSNFAPGLAGIQVNFGDGGGFGRMFGENITESINEFIGQIGPDGVVQFNRNARGVPEEVIKKYLPVSNVTQQHVENGAQCTTCFDMFKIGDEVGQLDCEHIFHRPCIEPWLKTKTSCPVCRQTIDINKWKKKYEEKKAEEQFNILEDLD